MGNNCKWIAVVIGAGLVAPAFAQDARHGEFQLTPYAGYAHLRMDGEHLEFGDTERIDGLAVGAGLAYHAPFGLVVELGAVTAARDQLLGVVFDFSASEYYLGLGYQFDFGDGWHFTPKLGFSRWHLESAFENVVDDDGVEQDSLDDDSTFFELGFMRDLNDRMALGLKLRDTDVSFGQVRTATVAFTWSF